MNAKVIKENFAKAITIVASIRHKAGEKLLVLEVKLKGKVIGKIIRDRYIAISAANFYVQSDEN